MLCAAPWQYALECAQVQRYHLILVKRPALREFSMFSPMNGERRGGKTTPQRFRKIKRACSERGHHKTLGLRCTPAPTAATVMAIGGCAAHHAYGRSNLPSDNGSVRMDDVARHAGDSVPPPVRSWPARVSLYQYSDHRVYCGGHNSN